VNGKSLYSPKIKDDLIPVIYKKSKIQGKPMTDIVDDILRSFLIDDEADISRYRCRSCFMEVEVVDGTIGYCDHCESVVFIDKL